MALPQGYSSTKKVENDTSYTSIPSGLYVGIVKENRDPTRMGRLGVVIPTLDGAENVDKGKLIICDYLAPFYGAKSPNAVNTTNVTDYGDSQHSYGMWMVPPDIDTKVLVCFAEGKETQAYWIGCIQEPYVNHMIPGIASTENTFTPLQDTGGYDEAGVLPRNKKTTVKEELYGTNNLPAGEINRGIFTKEAVGGVDKIPKPIHPFAKTLRDQGLVQDYIRGHTTSSARRESPSNVFGISTPGPIDQRSSKTDKLGPTNDRRNVKTTRKPGHTFVMDDGDAQGQNQLIRLRTSSGHQLLMHDTAGVMYLANADGTVWMEFSNNGMVDVYAQTGYNLRSGADINFHAEGNINMYANKNIKIKANESTDENFNPNGGVIIDGAIIKQIATTDIRFQGQNVYTKAFSNIASDAGVKNIQQGRSRVDLIGGQVHFNSFGVSEVVPSMFRTTFVEPSGTGTGLTTYPDVGLQPLGTVLKVDRALPGLSGMRVPTHEPFWGHQDVVPSFGSVGGTDTTIGTAGYIEDANRNSDLMSIRWAQYKADITNELIKNPTKSLDSVTSLFNAGYSKLYGTATNFLNDKLTGYIKLGDGAFETYNQITSGIDKLKSTSATNVLVNEAGILYTKGVNQVIKTTGLDKVTGRLSNANTVINSIGSLLSTKTTEGGISVPGVGDIEGIIPGVGKVNSVYNNISKITETYKNVVGGKITSVTQVSSAISTFGKDVGTKVATVAKSIGKYFGFGA